MCVSVRAGTSAEGRGFPPCPSLSCEQLRDGGWNARQVLLVLATCLCVCPVCSFVFAEMPRALGSPQGQASGLVAGRAHGLRGHGSCPGSPLGSPPFTFIRGLSQQGEVSPRGIWTRGVAPGASTSGGTAALGSFPAVVTHTLIRVRHVARAVLPVSGAQGMDFGKPSGLLCMKPWV